MLLAVSKVMVEMVTVVLEDIVFIIDFPTGTDCSDGLHDIVFVNAVRYGPRHYKSSLNRVMPRGA